jgi:hypothetical protein
MNLSIKDFVLKNKSLFEDVNKDYQNIDRKYDTQYTILDYEKIIGEMIEYVQGYVKYRESDDDKYRNKILSTTHRFYDSMFMDKKYRKTITLHDFKSINKIFLEKTRELQTLLEKYTDDPAQSELCALCEMTDKQYKKVSKVYSDDMKIYLYLISSNSKVFNKPMSPELRKHYNDRSTPVMHIKKNDD